MLCGAMPLYAEADNRKLILDMVHHNPGEARTVSRYLDADYLREAGYGGKVFFLFDAAQFGLDWRGFDADVFPEGSDGAAWVSSRADSITAGYGQASRAGLDVYCMLDMMVLPRRLVELYADSITDREGKIDISRPFTQKCVRYMLRSMFETFPDLDGLIIRTGETYLHDAPHHVGNHPVRHGMADHVTLINLLRDEVCVRLGRKVIYRTWDMGQLHSLPHHYLGVTDSVEPHPGLYFSIKHTMTDFWRGGLPDNRPAVDSYDTYWLEESGRYGVPFNPCLGIGRHRQIAEVQCQREYEGKGAHPNYVAHGVIEGFGELTACQRPYALSHLAGSGLLSGVWTWSRGGGWGGPYIGNEFWIDLNARVMARWAADTSRPEEECFNEVVLSMGLDEADLQLFRRMCLLTEDGVLKGQYSGYGGTYVNWTRDDSMTGDAFQGPYIDRIINEGMTAKYIAEKDEAVEIWREIERLSRLVHFKDESTNEFIAVSATYGRIKYEILATAWRVMLMGRQKELNKAAYDAREMARCIEAYDRLWAEWAALKEKYTCCPTLYKGSTTFFGNEVGIDAMIDRCKRSLKVKG